MPFDFKKLAQDPDFLTGIAQIVSGAMGAGSMGQAIGETTELRKRRQLQEKELEEQAAYRKEQQRLQKQNQYLQYVDRQQKDRKDRLDAALKQLDVFVKESDPSKLNTPEGRQAMMEPAEMFGLDDLTKAQYRKMAEGRVRSADFTTLDIDKMEIGVPFEPDNPSVLTLPKKDAVTQLRQLKSEAASREKEKIAARKQEAIDTRKAIEEATRVNQELPLIADLRNMENPPIPADEAEGIASRVRARQAQEEANIRRTEAATKASEAAAAKMAQGGANDETRQLKAEEKAKLVKTILSVPGPMGQQIYDGLPSTAKRDIVADLVAGGFTGSYGKPLSEAAITKISESRSAVMQLQDLRGVLKQYEQYLGPITGLAAYNPYSDARKAQATIELVRQRVGKALEGGVLRAEDTKKYQIILARLTDEPSTAFYKLDKLIEDISRDIDNYAAVQGAAGRNVLGVQQLGQPGKETAAPVIIDLEVDPKTKRHRKR